MPAYTRNALTGTAEPTRPTLNHFPIACPASSYCIRMAITLPSTVITDWALSRDDLGRVRLEEGS